MRHDPGFLDYDDNGRAEKVYYILVWPDDDNPDHLGTGDKMMMMTMMAMMTMMMREQSDYPAGLSNRASLGSSYVSRVVSNA